MKYRKKPIVVEAIKFDGTNFDEIQRFTNRKVCKTTTVDDYGTHITYSFLTLEGEMRFCKGYYIIKGVADEFYPCQPDVFEATYEVIEDEKIQSY